MTKEQGVFARLLCLGAILASAFGSCLADEEDSAKSARELVILDEHSFWRGHFTYLPEVVQKESGESYTIQEETVKWGHDEVKTKVFSSQPPPADWAVSDFDDSSWLRRPGPFLGLAWHYGANRRDTPTPPLRLLCLRGKFEVRDPTRVKNLSLSLSYQGGVVVYLNGKEVARGHMREGEVAFDTPAIIYPEKAYIDEGGYLLPTISHEKQTEHEDRYRMRNRHLENIPIPSSLLRKGVNVLALELHRPPSPEVWKKAKVYGGMRQFVYWPMIVFQGLRLVSKPSDAIVPNVARPEKVCLTVANPLVGVNDRDYADSNERVRPITLVGARNGSFSGQVVLSAPKPIQGLEVRTSDLVQSKGGGRIPSSYVQIRYALPDGSPCAAERAHYKNAKLLRRFDGLEETLPAQATRIEESEGITQPVWVTVNVPRDTRPGDYTGTLSVSVNGSEPIEVPVALYVADFALPCPKDFVSYLSLAHSPETIALKYSLPLWSQAHWALEEKAFEFLGQVGTNSVFIPLIANTHFGNDHGMVYWIKKKDGTYTYDYTVFEKYLDLAIKHLGKNLVVCFYVWDPKEAYRNPRECIPLHVTVQDHHTGELSLMPAPTWDSPQSAPFWKPVFDRLKEHLATRDMLKSMAVGMMGQGNPGVAVNVLDAIIPEARWVVVQHPYVAQVGGKPAAESSTVYHFPGNMNLVPFRRFYGWQDPRVITYFPRGQISLKESSPIPLYRLVQETLQASGIDGVGRLGADFWFLESHVGRERRARITRPNWAQLSLGGRAVGQLLAPGKRGPIATVRFEMLRQGIQETETRIFIEKALTDPGKRALVGKALAERCEAVLDERIRAMAIAVGTSRDGHIGYRYLEEPLLWYAATAARRSRKLYDLAAEVARKLEVTAAPYY